MSEGQADEGSFMNRWSVGIMGAGMMAQGYDQPGDDEVLSMAHAFAKSPFFLLGGFYDIDPSKSEAAEERWGCPETPRDRARWLNAKWDVLYVATPDGCHADDLRDALAHHPRAILVEKPLAVSSSEGLELIQKAKKLGIPLIVNFPRRWHSAIPKMSEAILAGKIGTPVSAVFIVSGGVAHNLPHALDLFMCWWGGGWHISFMGNTGRMTFLEFARGDVSFQSTVIDRPGDLYYVFEIHIYCSTGKIELSHSPEIIELSSLQAHPAYASYRVLTPFFRVEMEGGPLLYSVVEALRAVISNPKEAEEAYCRELESQTLMAEALQHF
jgi:hypothetical protein